ncbi:group 1 glycosyl transferase [Stanieria sp. NIES-3757]|nr:group 1 glycosyl transferase [Stanieria sp. NIES-3757]
MNFQNIRVLVDGYNLELQQGTGIKTYGISLIKALNLLQAEIDILYSGAKQTKKQDSPVTEVLFFDPNFQKLGKLSQALSVSKILSKASFTPQRLKFNDIVIRNPKDILNSQFFNFLGVLNLPLCYQLSNYFFQKFNLELIIKPDYPWQIFHATYPLPIKVKGAKKITTIHDLIPLRLPYATLDDKDFFYRLIKYSIKTSDLIITVSEYSKKDLVEIFNCPAEKVAVTYSPVALPQQEVSSDKLSVYLRKYNLNYQKYILFVGAIEPKKNLGCLIDAYAMLNPDIPLVIVGKKAWLWEQDLAKIDFIVKKKSKSKTELEKVLVLDYVPTNDLPYLFQGAYCFVFPSLYEGFGLPVLEAMSFGCPVITSKVASLPEVCGDAALYIDPYNAEDLSDKLQQILTDPNLRDRLSLAGRKRAEFFSMDNYQHQLMAAYNQVLNP